MMNYKLEEQTTHTTHVQHIFVKFAPITISKGQEKTKDNMQVVKYCKKKLSASVR